MFYLKRQPKPQPNHQPNRQLQLIHCPFRCYIKNINDILIWQFKYDVDLKTSLWSHNGPGSGWDGQLTHSHESKWNKFKIIFSLSSFINYIFDSNKIFAITYKYCFSVRSKCRSHIYISILLMLNIWRKSYGMAFAWNP